MAPTQEAIKMATNNADTPIIAYERYLSFTSSITLSNPSTTSPTLTLTENDGIFTTSYPLFTCIYHMYTCTGEYSGIYSCKVLIIYPCMKPCECKIHVDCHSLHQTRFNSSHVYIWYIHEKPWNQSTLMKLISMISYCTLYETWK